jgi:dihydrofolate reductase
LTRIALIAAVADNRVIGANGALPWKISADLKHFKALTMSKPVVMGRRTFDSIGRPLPGRPNIVVSRGNALPDGVDVASDFEEAVAVARRRAAECGAEEIMIIGGETLYRALLPRAERIYLTEVHEEVEGDAFFPELDAAEWVEVSREDRADIYRAPVSFVTLERRRAQASRSARPNT